jgi:hypothetical protein
MASSRFFYSVPALAGLLALTACGQPPALPPGPSPRADAPAPAAVDIAALQRTARALAADPGVGGAVGRAVADLPEAKRFAQQLDAEFWARLEAAARTQPVLPVPPR